MTETRNEARLSSLGAALPARQSWAPEQQKERKKWRHSCQADVTVGQCRLSTGRTPPNQTKPNPPKAKPRRQASWLELWIVCLSVSHAGGVCAETGRVVAGGEARTGPPGGQRPVQVQVEVKVKVSRSRSRCREPGVCVGVLSRQTFQPTVVDDRSKSPLFFLAFSPFWFYVVWKLICSW